MLKKVKNKLTKNHLIFIIISLFTVFIVSYFAYWYTQSKDYRDISIMEGFLLEIGEDEVISNLNSYLLDNSNMVLYVSSGNSNEFKLFERELKDYIKNLDDSYNIVFIDLDKVIDAHFISKLEGQFLTDQLINNEVKLYNQANIYIFENKKIVDMLYYSKKRINIDDVKEFLIEKEEVLR